MSIGWIVGSSLATVVLLAGIISLFIGIRKSNHRRWPWWFIGFGVAALVSAAINYPGT
ncbi:hypothetical protein P4H27_19475 [Paenibacillus taichungensis]|uniref:Uncharacterized protein n=2 Tax=Paenibacillus TaxID=44249 RepID=A0A855XU48_9BACL|nr:MULTISPECIES: hypothetical protein [Paenibacillus]MDR9745168.1 hypothetical protein [Paenibacillus taichungensis]MEC0109147.1 hypothetical protein [Paenibacillus taichungensis]MEC0198729.1 hypothetical protein [Paenibacillus taichungensis]NUU53933.1 hypothetical protein [Paenibacillus taichungensis]PWW39867.1 hypothetical protein DET56_106253 [Paenibacillus pabuli]